MPRIEPGTAKRERYPLCYAPPPCCLTLVFEWPIVVSNMAWHADIQRVLFSFPRLLPGVPDVRLQVALLGEVLSALEADERPQALVDRVDVDPEVLRRREGLPADVADVRNDHRGRMVVRGG